MTRNFRFSSLLGIFALSAAFLGSTANAEPSTSSTMTITGNAPAVAAPAYTDIVTRITPEKAEQLKAGTPITLAGERVGEIEKVDYSKESGQARLKIKIDRAAFPKFSKTNEPVEVKAGDVPLKMSVTRTGSRLSADRKMQHKEDVKIEQKTENGTKELPKAKESSSVTPKATIDQLASSVSDLRTWADNAPEVSSMKGDIAALETSVKGLSADQNLTVAANEIVRQAREVSTKLQDAGLGEKAENLDEAVANLRIDLARS